MQTLKFIKTLDFLFFLHIRQIKRNLYFKIDIFNIKTRLTLSKFIPKKITLREGMNKGERNVQQFQCSRRQKTKYIKNTQTMKIHIMNKYTNLQTERIQVRYLIFIYLLNKIIPQKYIFNISLPNKEKTTASFFISKHFSNRDI